MPISASGFSQNAASSSSVAKYELLTTPTWKPRSLAIFIPSSMIG